MSEAPIFIPNLITQRITYLGTDETARDRDPKYPEEVWINFNLLPDTPPPARDPPNVDVLPDDNFALTYSTLQVDPGSVPPRLIDVTAIPDLTDDNLADVDDDPLSATSTFSRVVPSTFADGAYAVTLTGADGNTVTFDTSWVVDPVQRLVEFSSGAFPAGLDTSGTVRARFWKYYGPVAGGGAVAQTEFTDPATQFRVILDPTTDDPAEGGVTTPPPVATAVNLIQGDGVEIVRDGNLNLRISTSAGTSGVDDLNFYVSSANGSDGNLGIEPNHLDGGLPNPAGPLATLATAVNRVLTSGWNDTATIQIIDSADLGASFSFGVGPRGQQRTPLTVRGYRPSASASGAASAVAVGPGGLLTFTDGTGALAVGDRVVFTAGAGLANGVADPDGTTRPVDALVAKVDGATATLAYAPPEGATLAASGTFSRYAAAGAPKLTSTGLLTLTSDATRLIFEDITLEPTPVNGESGIVLSGTTLDLQGVVVAPASGAFGLATQDAAFCAGCPVARRNTTSGLNSSGLQGSAKGLLVTADAVQPVGGYSAAPQVELNSSAFIGAGGLAPNLPLAGALRGLYADGVGALELRGATTVSHVLVDTATLAEGVGALTVAGAVTAGPALAVGTVTSATVGAAALAVAGKLTLTTANPLTVGAADKALRVAGGRVVAEQDFAVSVAADVGLEMVNGRATFAGNLTCAGQSTAGVLMQGGTLHVAGNVEASVTGSGAQQAAIDLSQIARMSCGGNLTVRDTERGVRLRSAARLTVDGSAQIASQNTEVLRTIGVDLAGASTAIFGALDVGRAADPNTANLVNVAGSQLAVNGTLRLRRTATTGYGLLVTEGGRVVLQTTGADEVAVNSAAVAIAVRDGGCILHRSNPTTMAGITPAVGYVAGDETTGDDAAATLAQIEAKWVRAVCPAPLDDDTLVPVPASLRVYLRLTGVANPGNDTNTGLAPDSPVATFARAFEVVQESGWDDDAKIIVTGATGGSPAYEVALQLFPVGTRGLQATPLQIVGESAGLAVDGSPQAPPGAAATGSPDDGSLSLNAAGLVEFTTNDAVAVGDRLLFAGGTALAGVSAMVAAVVGATPATVTLAYSDDSLVASDIDNATYTIFSPLTTLVSLTPTLDVEHAPVTFENVKIRLDNGAAAAVEASADLLLVNSVLTTGEADAELTLAAGAGGRITGSGLVVDQSAGTRTVGALGETTLVSSAVLGSSTADVASVAGALDGVLVAGVSELRLLGSPSVARTEVRDAFAGAGLVVAGAVELDATTLLTSTQLRVDGALAGAPSLAGAVGGPAVEVRGRLALAGATTISHPDCLNVLQVSGHVTASGALTLAGSATNAGLRVLGGAGVTLAGLTITAGNFAYIHQTGGDLQVDAAVDATGGLVFLAGAGRLTAGAGTSRADAVTMSEGAAWTTSGALTVTNDVTLASQAQLAVAATLTAGVLTADTGARAWAADFALDRLVAAGARVKGGAATVAGAAGSDTTVDLTAGAELVLSGALAIGAGSTGAPLAASDAAVRVGAITDGGSPTPGPVGGAMAQAGSVITFARCTVVVAGALLAAGDATDQATPVPATVLDVDGGTLSVLGQLSLVGADVDAGISRGLHARNAATVTLAGAAAPADTVDLTAGDAADKRPIEVENGSCVIWRDALANATLIPDELYAGDESARTVAGAVTRWDKAVCPVRAAAVPDTLELYVDTGAATAGDGTAAAPYQTLEEALREATATGWNVSATVFLTGAGVAGAEIATDAFGRQETPLAIVGNGTTTVGAVPAADYTASIGGAAGLYSISFLDSNDPGVQAGDLAVFAGGQGPAPVESISSFGGTTFVSLPLGVAPTGDVTFERAVHSVQLDSVRGALTLRDLVVDFPGDVAVRGGELRLERCAATAAAGATAWDLAAPLALEASTLARGAGTPTLTGPTALTRSALLGTGRATFTALAADQARLAGEKALAGRLSQVVCAGATDVAGALAAAAVETAGVTVLAGGHLTGAVELLFGTLTAAGGHAELAAGTDLQNLAATGGTVRLAAGAAAGTLTQSAGRVELPTGATLGALTLTGGALHAPGLTVEAPAAYDSAAPVASVSAAVLDATPGNLSVFHPGSATFANDVTLLRLADGATVRAADLEARLTGSLTVSGTAPGARTVRHVVVEDAASALLLSGDCNTRHGTGVGASVNVTVTDTTTGAAAAAVDLTVVGVDLRGQLRCQGFQHQHYNDGAGEGLLLTAAANDAGAARTAMLDVVGLWARAGARAEVGGTLLIDRVRPQINLGTNGADTVAVAVNALRAETAEVTVAVELGSNALEIGVTDSAGAAESLELAIARLAAGAALRARRMALNAFTVAGIAAGSGRGVGVLHAADAEVQLWGEYIRAPSAGAVDFVASLAATTLHAPAATLSTTGAAATALLTADDSTVTLARLSDGGTGAPVALAGGALTLLDDTTALDCGPLTVAGAALAAEAAVSADYLAASGAARLRTGALTLSGAGAPGATLQLANSTLECGTLGVDSADTAVDIAAGGALEVGGAAIWTVTGAAPAATVAAGGRAALASTLTVTAASTGTAVDLAGDFRLAGDLALTAASATRGLRVGAGARVVLGDIPTTFEVGTALGAGVTIAGIEADGGRLTLGTVAALDVGPGSGVAAQRGLYLHSGAAGRAAAITTGAAGTSLELDTGAQLVVAGALTASDPAVQAVVLDNQSRLTVEGRLASNFTAGDATRNIYVRASELMARDILIDDSSAGASAAAAIELVTGALLRCGDDGTGISIRITGTKLLAGIVGANSQIVCERGVAIGEALASATPGDYPGVLARGVDLTRCELQMSTDVNANDLVVTGAGDIGARFVGGQAVVGGDLTVECRSVSAAAGSLTQYGVLLDDGARVDANQVTGRSRLSETGTGFVGQATGIQVDGGAKLVVAGNLLCEADVAGPVGEVDAAGRGAGTDCRAFGCRVLNAGSLLCNGQLADSDVVRADAGGGTNNNAACLACVLDVDAGAETEFAIVSIGSGLDLHCIPHDGSGEAIFLRIRNGSTFHANGNVTMVAQAPQATGSGRSDVFGIVLDAAEFYTDLALAIFNTSTAISMVGSRLGCDVVNLNSLQQPLESGVVTGSPVAIAASVHSQINARSVAISIAGADIADTEARMVRLENSHMDLVGSGGISTAFIFSPGNLPPFAGTVLELVAGGLYCPNGRFVVDSDSAARGVHLREGSTLRLRSSDGASEGDSIATPAGVPIEVENGSCAHHAGAIDGGLVLDPLLGYVAGESGPATVGDVEVRWQRAVCPVRQVSELTSAPAALTVLVDGVGPDSNDGLVDPVQSIERALEVVKTYGWNDTATIQCLGSLTIPVLASGNTSGRLRLDLGARGRQRTPVVVRGDTTTDSFTVTSTTFSTSLPGVPQLTLDGTPALSSTFGRLTLTSGAFSGKTYVYRGTSPTQAWVPEIDAAEGVDLSGGVDRAIFNSQLVWDDILRIEGSGSNRLVFEDLRMQAEATAAVYTGLVADACALDMRGVAMLEPPSTNGPLGFGLATVAGGLFAAGDSTAPGSVAGLLYRYTNIATDLGGIRAVVPGAEPAPRVDWANTLIDPIANGAAMSLSGRAQHLALRQASITVPAALEFDDVVVYSSETGLPAVDVAAGGELATTGDFLLYRNNNEIMLRIQAGGEMRSEDILINTNAQNANAVEVLGQLRAASLDIEARVGSAAADNGLLVAAGGSAVVTGALTYSGAGARGPLVVNGRLEVAGQEAADDTPTLGAVTVGPGAELVLNDHNADGTLSVATGGRVTISGSLDAASPGTGLSVAGGVVAVGGDVTVVDPDASGVVVDGGRVEVAGAVTVSFADDLNTPEYGVRVLGGALTAATITVANNRLQSQGNPLGQMAVRAEAGARIVCRGALDAHGERWAGAGGTGSDDTAIVGVEGGSTLTVGGDMRVNGSATISGTGANCETQTGLRIVDGSRVVIDGTLSSTRARKEAVLVFAGSSLEVTADTGTTTLDVRETATIQHAGIRMQQNCSVAVRTDVAIGTCNTGIYADGGGSLTLQNTVTVTGATEYGYHLTDLQTNTQELRATTTTLTFSMVRMVRCVGKTRLWSIDPTNAGASSDALVRLVSCTLECNTLQLENTVSDVTTLELDNSTLQFSGVATIIQSTAAAGNPAIQLLNGSRLALGSLQVPEARTALRIDGGSQLVTEGSVYLGRGSTDGASNVLHDRALQLVDGELHVGADLFAGNANGTSDPTLSVVAVGGAGRLRVDGGLTVTVSTAATALQVVSGGEAAIGGTLTAASAATATAVEVQANGRLRASAVSAPDGGLLNDGEVAVDGALVMANATLTGDTRAGSMNLPEGSGVALSATNCRVICEGTLVLGETAIGPTGAANGLVAVAADITAGATTINNTSGAAIDATRSVLRLSSLTVNTSRYGVLARASRIVVDGVSAVTVGDLSASVDADVYGYDLLEGAELVCGGNLTITPGEVTLTGASLNAAAAGLRAAEGSRVACGANLTVNQVYAAVNSSGTPSVVSVGVDLQSGATLAVAGDLTTNGTDAVVGNSASSATATVVGLRVAGGARATVAGNLSATGTDVVPGGPTTLETVAGVLVERQSTLTVEGTTAADTQLAAESQADSVVYGLIVLDNSRFHGVGLVTCAQGYRGVFVRYDSVMQLDAGLSIIAAMANFAVVVLDGGRLVSDGAITCSVGTGILLSKDAAMVAVTLDQTSTAAAFGINMQRNSSLTVTDLTVSGATATGLLASNGCQITAASCDTISTSGTFPTSYGLRLEASEFILHDPGMTTMAIAGGTALSLTDGAAIHIAGNATMTANTSTGCVAIDLGAGCRFIQDDAGSGTAITTVGGNAAALRLVEAARFVVSRGVALGAATVSVLDVGSQCDVLIAGDLDVAAGATINTNTYPVLVAGGRLDVGGALTVAEGGLGGQRGAAVRLEQLARLNVGGDISTDLASSPRGLAVTGGSVGKLGGGGSISAATTAIEVENGAELHFSAAPSITLAPAAGFVVDTADPATLAAVTAVWDLAVCPVRTPVYVVDDLVVYAAPTSASPAGDDANDGLTVSTPVATLERALEVAYTEGWNNTATIQLASGTVQVLSAGNTTGALRLLEGDHGLQRTPVVVRGNTSADEYTITSTTYADSQAGVPLVTLTGTPDLVNSIGRLTLTSGAFVNNSYVYSPTSATQAWLPEIDATEAASLDGGVERVAFNSQLAWNDILRVEGAGTNRLIFEDLQMQATATGAVFTGLVADACVLDMQGVVLRGPPITNGPLGFGLVTVDGGLFAAGDSSAPGTVAGLSYYGDAAVDLAGIRTQVPEAEPAPRVDWTNTILDPPGEGVALSLIGRAQHLAMRAVSLAVPGVLELDHFAAWDSESGLPAINISAGGKVVATADFVLRRSSNVILLRVQAGGAAQAEDIRIVTDAQNANVVEAYGNLRAASLTIAASAGTEVQNGLLVGSEGTALFTGALSYSNAQGTVTVAENARLVAASLTAGPVTCNGEIHVDGVTGTGQVTVGRDGQLESGNIALTLPTGAGGASSTVLTVSGRLAAGAVQLSAVDTQLNAVVLSGADVRLASLASTVDFSRVGLELLGQSTLTIDGLLSVTSDADLASSLVRGISAEDGSQIVAADALVGLPSVTVTGATNTDVACLAITRSELAVSNGLTMQSATIAIADGTGTVTSARLSGGVVRAGVAVIENNVSTVAGSGTTVENAVELTGKSTFQADTLSDTVLISRETPGNTFDSTAIIAEPRVFTEPVSGASRFYYGEPQPFSDISYTVSAAWAEAEYDTVISAEYWNGSTWSPVAITPSGSGFFDALGAVTATLTPPGDWAETAVDGETAYWVRLEMGQVTPDPNIVGEPDASAYFPTSIYFIYQNGADDGVAIFSGTGQGPNSSSPYGMVGGINIGERIYMGQPQPYGTIIWNASTSTPPAPEDFAVKYWNGSIWATLPDVTTNQANNAWFSSSPGTAAGVVVITFPPPANWQAVPPALTLENSPAPGNPPTFSSGAGASNLYYIMIDMLSNATSNRYEVYDPVVSVGNLAALDSAYAPLSGAETTLSLAAQPSVFNGLARETDVRYFGAPEPFNFVHYNTTTAWQNSADDALVAFEYWDGTGSAWTALSGVTTSINLTPTSAPEYFVTAGTVALSFAKSSLWGTTTVNGINQYWVRLRVTGIPSSQSIATSPQITVNVSDDNYLLDDSSTFHAVTVSTTGSITVQGNSQFSATGGVTANDLTVSESRLVADSIIANGVSSLSAGGTISTTGNASLAGSCTLGAGTSLSSGGTITVNSGDLTLGANAALSGTSLSVPDGAITITGGELRLAGTLSVTTADATPALSVASGVLVAGAVNFESVGAVHFQATNSTIAVASLTAGGSVQTALSLSGTRCDVTGNFSLAGGDSVTTAMVTATNSELGVGGNLTTVLNGADHAISFAGGRLYVGGDLGITSAAASTAGIILTAKSSAQVIGTTTSSANVTDGLALGVGAVFGGTGAISITNASTDAIRVESGAVCDAGSTVTATNSVIRLSGGGGLRAVGALSALAVIVSAGARLTTLGNLTLTAASGRLLTLSGSGATIDVGGNVVLTVESESANDITQCLIGAGAHLEVVGDFTSTLNDANAITPTGGRAVVVTGGARLGVGGTLSVITEDGTVAADSSEALPLVVENGAAVVCNALTVDENSPTVSAPNALVTIRGGELTVEDVVNLTGGGNSVDGYSISQGGVLRHNTTTANVTVDIAGASGVAFRLQSGARSYHAVNVVAQRATYNPNSFQIGGNGSATTGGAVASGTVVNDFAQAPSSGTTTGPQMCYVAQGNFA